MLNSIITTQKIAIFDIQRNSYVDGPGVRTTVFFKGCNLKCLWCHNPESQKMEKEIMHYENKCTGCGRCKGITTESQHFICFNDAIEICGREYTVDEVYKEVSKDIPYYENSGGGVTFSGGECMLQIDFLLEILKKCKKNGIHTAVDTAGCVPWEYFEKIMPYTDLFLYDVKCITSELHKKGTGVGNELILENLTKLSHSFSGEIHIRIPLIGGFNDDILEMQKASDFLKNIRTDKIELLPYHGMGEHKYKALGMEEYSFSVPDKEIFKHLFN